MMHRVASGDRQTCYVPPPAHRGTPGPGQQFKSTCMVERPNSEHFSHPRFRRCAPTPVPVRRGMGGLLSRRATLVSPVLEQKRAVEGAGNAKRVSPKNQYLAPNSEHPPSRARRAPAFPARGGCLSGPIATLFCQCGGRARRAAASLEGCSSNVTTGPMPASPRGT